MKAIESKLFLISQPILQSVANYLVTRPYNEVHIILDRLKQLQEAEVEEEKPEPKAPIALQPKAEPTVPTEVPAVAEDLT